MITLHYDGLGINATSGPLTGFRVAHVKSECHGFTEQERNELGRAMAAAPELLDTLQAIRNDAQAFLDYKSDIDPYELAEAILSACEVSIARATQS